MRTTACARRDVPTAPLAGLLTTCLCATLASSAPAQVWETAANHPGDDRFHQPDHIVTFVATLGESDPIDETPAHFGLDVISAANPAEQGPGGGLWALMPDGQVKKLFPLPEHEAVPGLIDTPLGQLDKGAVVEPNVSEHGKTLYFAYFHDAAWEPFGGGWQSWRVSYKGADLYRLDVAPLLADHDLDPAALPIQRLTFKEYYGAAKLDVEQTFADKFKDAVNPSEGSDFLSHWGTVDMHLIEMRTVTGLKAVWVSNRTRTGNSNLAVGEPNHNFNLFIADILPDGSLGHPHQFQYYTTTSALSPAPLRNGMAFSYQSSTEEERRWDIQKVDSEGRWAPLFGYGHGSELFHLGTLIVAPDPAGQLTDYFIGVKYYNVNDGGFGTLHVLDVADAGINTFSFVDDTMTTEPRQLSTKLTIGATALDDPSDTVQVDGQTVFIGKVSSPRAGRVGGEYYMAYTPTSANKWKYDIHGQKGVYRSLITYRPNLEPFEPHEPVDVQNGKGLYTVIEDSADGYNLMWPTPLLTWEERTGMAQQEVAAPIVDPNTPIARGLPYAQVGTSAVYNTDIRPFDCWLMSTGTTPYSPNTIAANDEVRLVKNVEGLRYVQNPDSFCEYLDPAHVLGIAVNITSSQVDLESMNTVGYETDHNGKKEAVERLGVYSVAEENDSDFSFIARIPADTAFDFHLLHRETGMKLVDVRSWHSLQPRESRTDCGGCHHHEAGFGIAFEGTEASSKSGLDMTNQTKYVAYDADCRPVIALADVPTVQTPEWTQDIWPGFSQHCGACHDVGLSSDPLALAALDFADEAEAYTKLVDRHYASSVDGALGSPAFWAAYGARTDGRDNGLAVYQPNYAFGQYGFRFSPIHATNPGLCAASNPEWADWVRDLGVWIDNHMPRDTGDTSFGYKFDRYPPTLDFAITDDPVGVRIGYWDNSGVVDLEIRLFDVPVALLPGRPNGSFTVPIPPLPANQPVKIIAIDGQGNRQIKEKSLKQLIAEYVLGAG